MFADNLGIFAFYLALLLGPTYYLRRRLGVRTWRFAHRFVLVVYVLSVWHALIIGADVEHYGWARPALWLLQIPLLVLLAWRLVRSSPPTGSPTTGPARPPLPARARIGAVVRYALAAASIAAAFGTMVVVATGQWATVVPSIQ